MSVIRSDKTSNNSEAHTTYISFGYSAWAFISYPESYF